CARSPLDYW
nr:immunoglobulin heavy chain junction region [Mus musculus]